MRQEGPTVTTTRSCSGCMWLESEYYRCQGDSGHDYMCRHPTVREKPQRERYIGDCRTVTPDWCPVPRASTETPAPLTLGQAIDDYHEAKRAYKEGGET